MSLCRSGREIRPKQDQYHETYGDQELARQVHCASLLHSVAAQTCAGPFLHALMPNLQLAKPADPPAGRWRRPTPAPAPARSRGVAAPILPPLSSPFPLLHAFVMVMHVSCRSCAFWWCSQKNCLWPPLSDWRPAARPGGVKGVPSRHLFFSTSSVCRASLHPAIPARPDAESAAGQAS